LLQEAQINLTQLQQELAKAEIRQLLSDPYDQNGAYLTITVESDSTDAQDWAHMLLRMYYLWAVSNLYKISVADIFDRDEAAIKYGLEITGRYAYG
jgi:peptide chain release factor 2